MDPKLRILIIDDERDLLDVLIRTLSDRGHQAIGISSGHDADGFGLAWNPDLIITDAALPGKSGIDVVKTIRAANATVPIIVISGHLNDRLRAGFQALHVQEVFAKPFEMNTLVSAVERLGKPSA